MNDVMIIMAAIAILQQKGVGAAVGYMEAHGMTTDEALSMIETFEKLREEARIGRILGMLPE